MKILAQLWPIAAIVAPLRKRRERKLTLARAAWMAQVRFIQDRQRHAPPGFAGVSSHGIPRDDWVRFCREVDAILAGQGWRREQ